MSTEIKQTWECTAPSPDAWSLGQRVGDKLTNAVAIVQRLESGEWDWIAYTRAGKRWGKEPSRDTAMTAAESALANVQDEPRR
jgi:hypothetical protein